MLAFDDFDDVDWVRRLFGRVRSYDSEPWFEPSERCVDQIVDVLPDDIRATEETSLRVVSALAVLNPDDASVAHRHEVLRILNEHVSERAERRARAFEIASAYACGWGRGPAAQPWGNGIEALAIKGAPVVGRCRKWLRESARIPQGLPQDWHAHAARLALRYSNELDECCERARCRELHRLQAWSPRERIRDTNDPLLLWQHFASAISGLNGPLRPKAFVSGMYFRVLEQEEGLRLVNLAWRICEEGHAFQRSRCADGHPVHRVVNRSSLICGNEDAHQNANPHLWEEHILFCCTNGTGHVSTRERNQPRAGKGARWDHHYEPDDALWGARGRRVQTVIDCKWLVSPRQRPVLAQLLALIARNLGDDEPVTVQQVVRAVSGLTRDDIKTLYEQGEQLALPRDVAKEISNGIREQLERVRCPLCQDPPPQNGTRLWGEW